MNCGTKCNVSYGVFIFLFNKISFDILIYVYLYSLLNRKARLVDKEREKKLVHKKKEKENKKYQIYLFIVF